MGLLDTFDMYAEDIVTSITLIIAGGISYYVPFDTEEKHNILIQAYAGVMLTCFVIILLLALMIIISNNKTGTVVVKESQLPTTILNSFSAPVRNPKLLTLSVYDYDMKVIKVRMLNLLIRAGGMVGVYYSFEQAPFFLLYEAVSAFFTLLLMPLVQIHFMRCHQRRSLKRPFAWENIRAMFGEALKELKGQTKKESKKGMNKRRR